MAGGNRDLKLSLRISTIVDGLKNLVGLNSEVKNLRSEAATPIPDPTHELAAGADRSSEAIGRMTKALVGIVSVREIFQFVDASVAEFARAESAFRGLEAVANNSGVGIGRAMESAQRLAADGLMSVAESSKALQNLLAAGYDISDAEKMLLRMKDIAIYGRQAHLALGEAVVSASEGIKNENSVLVDNIGLSKNLSVIWKEYAAQIGKSVAELTQQEKIQATVNGVMRETEAQAGNATKAVGGYQQRVAQADAETRKFMATLGELLAPLMAWAREFGVFIINDVAKPLIFAVQSMGVELARDMEILGIYKDALLSLDFSKVDELRKAAYERADEDLTRLAGKLDSGKLDFNPLGQSAKKAANDVSDASAQMAKAAQQAADERKKAVKEQIADAEKLRTALIKAFDDSIKSEEDYLKKAKQLRAEATARKSDGSVEGEASAMLDLIAAESKLQRIKASAPLEDVQAQAEQVKQLAASLNDEARATEAVNRAKLAEADALERAAAAESERQKALTEQQRQNDKRLTDLAASLKALENKDVKVSADTADATAAVEKFKYILDAIKDKTITLSVKTDGAEIPGHATGTILPGYGGGDRRLILAEDGEAITRKEAVAYYGRNFMAQLNAMRIPRFQSGGIVERVSQSSSAPQAGSGLQPVTLNFPGVGSWGVSARPDVVEEIRRTLAREALKFGRRG